MLTEQPDQTVWLREEPIMWVVYDEYTGEAREEWRFSSIEEAAEFVEESDDPLTYRIRYED